jgi:fumarate reductase subunit C
MVNPTEYLPKSYHPRVSTYWWLGRWPYLKFILRELSSVFVAFFVVVTLLQIRALGQGPMEYAAFQQWLRSPLILAINAVSFLFVLFHTVTWFNLAPKAMAVRMGGKRLPDLMIAAPNYIGWVVVSAVVAWIVLRG